jgi:hypothetical protein
VVGELARWGARYLSLPQPGDHVPSRAVRIGLALALRSGPAPERCIEVRIEDPLEPVAFRVSGGENGARIGEAEGEPQAPHAVVAGEPRAILELAAGVLDVSAAVGSGRLRVEGDVDAVRAFPGLFDGTFQTGSGAAGPPEHQKGIEACRS